MRLHEFSAAEVTLGREASEEGDKTSDIVDDIGSDDEFQILVVEEGKSSVI